MSERAMSAMSRLVVIDASAMVALLTDSGSDGVWVTAQVSDGDLAAPSLMPFETANILRRHETAAIISTDTAQQASADLLLLTIALWPYAALAHRAWELRHNLTIYDGAYVALAELTGATLVTLDRRIERAPGIRCPISTPGDL